MSRPEIIKKLKKLNPKLNNQDIEDVIDIFCQSIEEALINGKKAELRGFGTFLLKK